MFSGDLMPFLSGEICAEGMTTSPTSKKTFKSAWKRHQNRLQEWESLRFLFMGFDALVVPSESISTNAQYCGLCTGNLG